MLFMSSGIDEEPINSIQFQDTWGTTSSVEKKQTIFLAATLVGISFRDVHESGDLVRFSPFRTSQNLWPRHCPTGESLSMSCNNEHFLFKGLLANPF